MDVNDKKPIMNLLKTARGQIDGIITMVEEDRYCVDISKQILSISGLLKKANLKVLDQHIKHCVKQAFAQGREEKYIKEIIDLLDKYIR